MWSIFICFTIVDFPDSPAPTMMLSFPCENFKITNPKEEACEWSETFSSLSLNAFQSPYWHLFFLPFLLNDSLLRNTRTPSRDIGESEKGDSIRTQRLYFVGRTLAQQNKFGGFMWATAKAFDGPQSCACEPRWKARQILGTPSDGTLLTFRYSVQFQL